MNDYKQYYERLNDHMPLPVRFEPQCFSRQSAGFSLPTFVWLAISFVGLQFWVGTKNTTSFTALSKIIAIDANEYDRFGQQHKGYQPPSSTNGRNKTAELLYLVMGASGEQEMERKRQECLKDGLLFAENKILPETFAKYTPAMTSSTSNTTNSNEHTLPKIIHITSKTRCLTQPFYDNLEKWKSIDGYSLLFHDDDAKYRLIQSKTFLSISEELPNMEFILACMKNRGAMLADLWRYLIIYEYGGIYVDIDEAPGDNLFAPYDPEDFFKSSSRDALLIWYPKGSSISQYFLALSPKHPFLYYTLLATFGNLYSTNDILGQYVPSVTGSTTNIAWRSLMGGIQCTPGFWQISNQMVANRTMDIIHKGDAAKYVVRDPPWLSGEIEKEYYRKINATDYERNWGVVRASRNGISCWDMLYDVHVKKSGTKLDLVSRKSNASL